MGLGVKMIEKTQALKHCPADLAAPGSNPAEGGNLHKCKRAPIALTLQYHPPTALLSVKYC